VLVLVLAVTALVTASTARAGSTTSVTFHNLSA